LFNVIIKHFLTKLSDNDQINVPFLWTDMALKILAMDPEISTVDNACGWKALEMLARKPFAICRESQLSFWKSRLNSCLFASNPNFFNCFDIFDISQVVILLHYSHLDDNFTQITIAWENALI
jgi:hypothetical protein